MSRAPPGRLHDRGRSIIGGIGGIGHRFGRSGWSVEGLSGLGTASVAAARVPQDEPAAHLADERTGQAADPH